jgi:hypothetical protein
MSTSVILFALSGMLAPSVVSGEPAWMKEYATARQLGRMQEKPLAVFFGSGKAGWEQLSRDGRLPKEAKRLLAKNYVAVYIDTAGQTGRRLAGAFNVPPGPGLVISSRSGEFQAFRHEGDLDSETIARYLRRFSDQNGEVTRTETNPPPRVSYYPQPEAYYPPPGGFAPAFDGFGGGRGGC